MSSLLYPKIYGAVGWELTIQPLWNNLAMQATSGKEIRAKLWPYPIWEIGVKYVFLRDDVDDPNTQNTGLRTLLAFLGQHSGGFESFLLNLADLTQRDDDSAISGQMIGVGDGALTEFQLVRTIQASNQAGQTFKLTDLIQNPSGGKAKLRLSDGTNLVQNTHYSVSSLGVCALNVAPGAGVKVIADFIALWRVRFNTAEMANDRSQNSADPQFERMLPKQYTCKSVALTTVIE